MKTDLSVVIPTLGDNCLKETIAQLNNGTTTPAEIIVCIPEEYLFRLDGYVVSNLVIIGTDMRGQVAQRAVGFKNAQYDNVMQLDDDVLVDKYCIERLLKTLKANGTMATVGASLHCVSSGESVYKKPNKNKVALKVYYWLLNGRDGYRPGIIDKSGVNIGIDLYGNDQELINVEWLAGGCIMHYNNNLILDNYYPLEGKAYSEDLIHSYLLKKNGCRLLIDTLAKCSIETEQSSDYSLKEFTSIIVSDYRARKYFVRLSGRSIFRMNIYYIAWSISYTSNKIASWFNRSVIKNKKISQ